MKISASFLSIKDNLKENIKKLDQSSIDYLHLDIMDGKFVGNSTYTIDDINYLLENTTKPKDVHLMVSDVIKYIDDFKILNPEYITFHLEAVEDPLLVINYLKNNNIKVGISIKPNTSIETLIPYLSHIDLVLVMSVEPGYGGQEFIVGVTEKIDYLKKIKEKNNFNYIIEIDGGINDDTIKYCNHADIIVVGSYITNANNYQAQIDKLISNK